MEKRQWIAIWGVFGVAVTFVEAILRLGATAVGQLRGGITPAQTFVLVFASTMLVYVEGVRALQRRFAPSVVERSCEAAASGRRLWAVLAPLYAITLVGAPFRAIARTLAGVAAIVLCVVLVRMLPAPWRGMVDAAVALALTWGLVALLAQAMPLVARRASHAPVVADPQLARTREAI